MVRAISFINSMDSGSVTEGSTDWPVIRMSLKYQLQRIKLVVIDINQRVKEGIPVAYRIIQNHNGDDCLGQRNYHPHKILEHVAAVDLRSLLQLQRQCIYKKVRHNIRLNTEKSQVSSIYIGRIGEMQPLTIK